MDFTNKVIRTTTPTPPVYDELSVNKLNLGDMVFLPAFHKNTTHTEGKDSFLLYRSEIWDVYNNGGVSNGSRYYMRVCDLDFKNRNVPRRLNFIGFVYNGWNTQAFQQIPCTFSISCAGMQASLGTVESGYSVRMKLDTIKTAPMFTGISDVKIYVEENNSHKCKVYFGYSHSWSGMCGIWMGDNILQENISFKFALEQNIDTNGYVIVDHSDWINYTRDTIPLTALPIT